MNTTVFQRHTGTLQFFLISLAYGIAYLFNQSIHPTVLEYIVNIIIIEFPVLIYGWLIVGLFSLPIILMGDNVWLRRGLLLIVSLFALVTASSFTREFGHHGTLIYLWLLYVNYGSIFVAKIKFDRRSRLIGEIAMRTIFFLITYSLLLEILDLPNSVGSSWYNKEAALLFGLLYFSISTFVEGKRYFPRSANFLYHIFNDNYVRLPSNTVRYAGNKLKAHTVKYSNAHYWWMVLFLGIFLLAFTSFILYGTIGNPEIGWVGTLFLWLFLAPFFLLGVAFFGNGPWMAYKYFSAKPALLSFQKYELEHERKLYAEGFIPVYIEKEEREAFGLVLIGYKVILPADEFDIARVEKFFEQDITDNATTSTTMIGTDFKVDCKIPPIDNLKKNNKLYYVWHLQANLRDKSHNPSTANWKMAFTLPVDPPDLHTNTNTADRQYGHHHS